MAIDPAEEGREKKQAALLSVASALVLVSLKAFLVIRTGSLGVLSEALHSGLDLIAAIITFLSVRVSDQPADERHPYGHGKFENFSAFVETGLLVLTALYIIYEAFDRLFFRSVHIAPSLTAILVLFCALAVDLTRSRALARVAKKYLSEALEADALHFSTDVWSTMVVIAGIGLVWAGETWNIPSLIYADAMAGLVVAAVILPAAIVLATLAPQLVDFLYGDKWGPSAAALRYLAVLMVVRMLTSLAFDILTGLGATRYTVWLNAGWAVALVPALWIGAHMDGIRGAAIAHGVVAVFVALPLAVLALRVAGVSLAPTLPALVRPTIGAAIAAAVILLIDSVVKGNPFVQLSLAGGAGLIVYILVVVPLDKLRQVTTWRAHFR